MSRVKQNQSIDNVINSIAIIAQNQCSLSEKEKFILTEAIERLRLLKHKKGKTNQQIRNEISKVVELLITFLI